MCRPVRLSAFAPDSLSLSLRVCPCVCLSVSVSLCLNLSLPFSSPPSHGLPMVLSATFVNVTVRPTLVNVAFYQISTLYYKKYCLLRVYSFYLLKSFSLDAF